MIPFPDLIYHYGKLGAAQPYDRKPPRFNRCDKDFIIPRYVGPSIQEGVLLASAITPLMLFPICISNPNLCWLNPLMAASKYDNFWVSNFGI